MEENGGGNKSADLATGRRCMATGRPVQEQRRKWENEGKGKWKLERILGICGV